MAYKSEAKRQAHEESPKRMAAKRAYAARYRAARYDREGRTPRQRRGNDRMLELRTALRDILAADQPQTVRQVFYQMVSRRLVDKTENEYDGTVGRLLGEMREAGELPWDWIVDNTRWRRQPVLFNSPEEALRGLAEGYRRDPWKDAESHVEIWCEKDALAGVIARETEPYGVSLMVAKGYTSKTFAYEAAQEIEGRDKPVYIYHLGDSDPSGVDAARDLEEKLRRYTDAEVHFERVAVLDEHIIRWNLPLRPNKPGDPRTKKFAGAGSVELDAIPARELRKIVMDCIELHVEKDLFERVQLQQEKERQFFRTLRYEPKVTWW